MLKKEHRTMEDIFKRFASKELDDRYTSYEYIEYLEEGGGSTRGQFNESGQALRMRMTDRDSVSFPSDSFIQVRYTIEQNTATQTSAAIPITTGKIASVNGAWNLFRAARLLWNQEIVSDIRLPGYVKQVKGLVEYSDDYSRGQGKMELWDLDRGDGGIVADFREIVMQNISTPAFTSITGTANAIHVLSAGGANNEVLIPYYKGERLQILVDDAIIVDSFDVTAGITIDFVGAANGQTVDLLYRGRKLVFQTTNALATPTTFVGAITVNITPELVLTTTDATATTIISGSDDAVDDRYNSGFYGRRDRSISNLFLNDGESLTTNNSISLFIPVRTLFGLLRDNPIPIRGLDQELQLDRNLFEDMLLRDANVNGNLDGKIIFSHLSWWVPIITPTLKFKDIMDKQLSSGVPIDLIWDESNHYVRDAGTQANPTIDILTTSFKPMRCYVFLQLLSRDRDQTENNMIFDDLLLQRIFVRVNSDRQYPRREYVADFAVGANQDYSRVYSAYLNACNVTHSFNCTPAVSYEEFRDLYPLYYFDMSFRDESIWTNTSVAHINITLQLAATPAAYRVHAVIDTQRKMQIKGVDRRMVIQR